MFRKPRWVTPKDEYSGNTQQDMIKRRQETKKPVPITPISPEKNDKKVVTIPERDTLEMQREILQTQVTPWDQLTSQHDNITNPGKALLESQKEIRQIQESTREHFTQKSSNDTILEKTLPERAGVIDPKVQEMSGILEPLRVPIDKKEEQLSRPLKDKVDIEIKPAPQQEAKEPVQLPPDKVQEMVEKLKELVWIRGANDPEVQRLIEKLKANNIPIPPQIIEKISVAKEPAPITPEKAQEMVEKLKELVMTKGINAPETQRLLAQIRKYQTLIPVPVADMLREFLEKQEKK
jgi:uncharacterized protein YoaH (UPF0181 family)